jgi:hypothetical protein
MIYQQLHDHNPQRDSLYYRSQEPLNPGGRSTSSGMLSDLPENRNRMTPSGTLYYPILKSPQTQMEGRCPAGRSQTFLEKQKQDDAQRDTLLSHSEEPPNPRQKKKKKPR